MSNNCIFPIKLNGYYREFGFQLAPGKKHCGDDYKGDAPDPVFAIAKGTTIYSGLVNGFGSYGEPGGVIIIEHEIDECKFLALYGHIERLKKVGDTVNQTEIIGKLAEYRMKEMINGQTADYRADHLHFCIYMDTNLPPFPWGYRDNLNKFLDTKIFIKNHLGV
jgi:murein DD-endopeptidase MepM/ murein hydrolase activator NlpD